MKFRVGDKVILIGGDNWCNEAQIDIGKTGTITSFYLNGTDRKYSVRLLNPQSFDYLSWTLQASEIKLAGEQQLLFDFMRG